MTLNIKITSTLIQTTYLYMIQTKLDPFQSKGSSFNTHTNKV